MSLTESMLVIAAILVVIDFFILNDITTHIAFILICLVLMRLVDYPFLYEVLFGLVCWFILVVFHYMVWRKLVLKFVNKHVSPDRYLEGARGLVGEIGIIESTKSIQMVRVAGDLWNFESESGIQLNDETTVEIVSEENGVLLVKARN
jgi:membrane protein implicated in regulation of membrane protease activity